MNETITPPKPSTKSPDPAPNPREVQRAALRDLMKLATECAATEAEIEGVLKKSTEDAEKRSGQEHAGTLERHVGELNALRQSFVDQLAEIDTSHNLELDDVNAADRISRERIDRDFISIKSDLKKKLEQAVWLAESVLEAAQTGDIVERKRAKDVYEAQRDALRGLEVKAMGLLQLYSVPVPQDETLAPEPGASTQPQPASTMSPDVQVQSAGEGAGAVTPDIASAPATETTPATAAAITTTPSTATAPAITPATAAATATAPSTAVYVAPVSTVAPLDRFNAKLEEAESLARTLERLRIPRLFVGAQPYLFGFILVVLAVVIAQAIVGSAEPNPKAIGIGLGVAAVVGTVLGIVFRIGARKRVRATFVPLRDALEAAEFASREHYTQALRRLDRDLDHARTRCANEIQAAKDKALPVIQKATRNRETALQTATADYPRLVSRIEHRRDKARSETQAQRDQELTTLSEQHATELKDVAGQKAGTLARIREHYEASRLNLERRLNDGLARTQAPMEESNRLRATNEVLTDWADPRWQGWTPPRSFPASVRFGELTVDLKSFADAVPKQSPLRLALPQPFKVPTTLNFPRQASLLIEADRTGRDKAIHIIRMVMARLLTSLPPGRVRLTIIDPVGLGQNFAGFMHLADYDDQLVGGRIWTDAEHIEQRLANLTEHMETVIQKYLRNEFTTIDDYNEQAGELAEPYRILVVSDFPVGFQNTAFQRLSSIAASGARCGVYTIMFRDTRQSMPTGSHVDDLRQTSVVLKQQGDQFVWQDEVFRHFPLSLDPAPDEGVLTDLMHVVGRGAKEAKRVEVDFGAIAPSAGDFWTGDATSELRVPVGRSGATRLQYVRLGRGVAQHMLIAGKTGSGKSTLLHALVTNLAMWYSPDQVEFYLIDFKKGVEFKTYATNALPHARAVAVESDREFGLSVLQRLDAELGRRGELYRKAGVQDLAGYRATGGAERMPRTLLIIDEFQEFFSEDDKLAQDASLLLDRLVRQGRAFGIHVVLGSQTIGGTSGLARSTIGQMAVRVALQCSEADSQMILGDNNSAARLLSRPGEAIYNDAGGLVENNSPFQVAWLPDEKRDGFLKRVRDLATAKKTVVPGAVVFEGNAPADITRNPLLLERIEAKDWPARRGPGVAYMGEPVAIKEPTGIVFKRQAGMNVMVIGQQEESALAIFMSIMVSLATQHKPGEATFYLLDGTPADSSFAGELDKVRKALPTPSHNIDYRGVPEAMNELATELKKRQEDDAQGAGAVYVFVYGLQRYRSLRKQEESFSFSSSDEPKTPPPDKQLSDLLREGPALGMHTVAWCDTLASLERTLDRATMREFDHRVLFQMSAADSSNLIDSPTANKLGFFRALAFSEEQGVMEKFRPYAMPSEAWLRYVGEKLSARTT